MKKSGVYRMSIAAATVFFLMAVGPAGANCIVPVSQTRSVSGYAYVENYYLEQYDSDSASDAAVDFGLFDTSQSATATIDSGYASGGGWQISTIGSARITARGSQYANAEAYDWDSYGDASGSSLFDVTFEVSVTRDARIFGSASQYDSGYFTVVLTGPDGVVFEAYDDYYYRGEAYFDEIIALYPGTWRLQAQASGSCYSDYSYYGYSFADYDVTLDVCPFEASLTCVPGSGTLPFVSQFSVSVGNYESSRPASLVAARVNVTLADGSYFSNWRAGNTVITSGDTFNTVWNQDIPLLGTVVGSNEFTLEAMDVTPAPYNQPPYGPSGFLTMDSCTVTGLSE